MILEAVRKKYSYWSQKVNICDRDLEATGDAKKNLYRFSRAWTRMGAEQLQRRNS